MNDDVFKLIAQNHLMAAVRRLQEYAQLYPEVHAPERIERIAADYKLMLDYMERGFKDDQRQQLYQELLARTCLLEADTRLADKCRKSSFLSNTMRQAARVSWDNELIRYTLENFVSEVALLSLEEEERRKEKSRTLYQRHDAFMSLLFRKILLSTQWNEQTAAFFESLLLSPTVDVNDALLMASALLLACRLQFDYRKWRTLVNVFRQTTDKRLHQRTLVGWCLALKEGDETVLYADRMRALLKEVCASPDVRRELLELQMQVFHCINAERDNKKIQEDIFPTLMKNNNLRITRFGIEEVEDDPMQDILDPGAADRAMEEMEQTMQRMAEMQRQGADIYFSGFSQMKRFPFFNDVAHWLLPFFRENPGLNEVVDRLSNSNLMQNIVENAPFCDSDKYSFALAIHQVIDKLPPNVREMVGTAEAMGPISPREELTSPAFLRRMFLQDLYRFYRLFPLRADFDNPFDECQNDANKQPAVLKSFFFAQPVFGTDLLADQVGELGTFLLKHGRMGELRLLLNTYVGSRTSAAESTDVRLLLLSARCSEFFGEGSEVSFYERVLDLQPDNEVALRNLGQHHFAQGRYAEAENCYRQLLAKQPEKKSYLMSFAVALLYQGKTDEAMPVVYQLDYEHPDDLNVKRTLAWGLMAQEKLQQAYDAYSLILGSEHAVAEDYLNAGYCEWFMGNVSAAKSMFVLYNNKGKEPLDSHFLRDRNTLLAHGITVMDQILMADLLQV